MSQMFFETQCSWRSVECKDHVNDQLQHYMHCLSAFGYHNTVVNYCWLK